MRIDGALPLPENHANAKGGQLQGRRLNRTVPPRPILARIRRNCLWITTRFNS